MIFMLAFAVIATSIITFAIVAALDGQIGPPKERD